MKIVITDESLLPDELCEVTVKMTAYDWKGICETLRASGLPVMTDEEMNLKRVPRLSAIHDALNAPCSSCHGFKVVRNYDPTVDGAEKSCPDCTGTGKASVSGARLLEMDK